ncbi:hypothetical protein B0T18DRAFT_394595 [Schizothecium vesticola]|uniref:Uncharacterized protein n=1 Tax=Schizothecium vesticola TaxID=314040 RepID=A0AA40EH11_9PEZI|nr:hypothetical protein B0T18DRAFT_394595 [Schizothecium vesticola]
MKISTHNLLALAHLAMVMVLVHLAMVVAGTDTVSSSSSASKSVTTSASSKNSTSSKDKTKDTTKNTTTTSTERKRGLCCNASCRECTRVPCNNHTECRIFGFGICCRSPPVAPTDFSKNVMWGFIEDRDCYVLRKRVLHQV